MSGEANARLSGEGLLTQATGITKNDVSWRVSGEKSMATKSQEKSYDEKETAAKEKYKTV